MVSTNFDIYSAEWRLVSERAKNEIEEAIKEIISPATQFERVIFLRGRIESCRSLIELHQESLKQLKINPFYS
jgi:divalent metal cation (Fe/Co/Zn/Cd) transporter